jgi:hypothetical protein
MDEEGHQSDNDSIKDVDKSCCMMEVSQKSKPLLTKSTKKGFSKECVIEATKWVAFIENKGKRPKQSENVNRNHSEKRNYAQTLISGNHSEVARNKPIVRGRCAGHKTQLFLDSGAETNVVDAQFVKDLQLRQYPIKFAPSKGNIKCANGSTMPVLGFAIMSVEMGPSKMMQKFMVVPNLFPRVIIGIRTLKTMGITINPTEDCAFVGEGHKLAFLSRVDVQSEHISWKGNEVGQR